MSNVTKFVTADLPVSPKLSIDCYMLPSGEKRIGITGAALAVGRSKEYLSRLISSGGNDFDLLQAGGFTEKLIEGVVMRSDGKGSSIVKTISISDFDSYVNFECNKSNPSAFKLKGIELRNQSFGKKRLERGIQERLHRQLGGVMEIDCLAGRIDLLTATEIIEVKKIKEWKEAIGQILVYGHYYPSHQKRIHLIGETQTSFLKMIESHAEQFQIVVTWRVK